MKSSCNKTKGYERADTVIASMLNGEKVVIAAMANIVAVLHN